MMRLTIYPAVLLVITVAGAGQSALAETTKSEVAQEPSSVTTADPTLLEDHLLLLVKPLTTEELVVEADAWRDLLKAKIQQIGQQQIAVNRQDVAAEQIAADAEKKAESGSDTNRAKEKDAKQADQKKQNMAESLPKLQEEKAQLIDRLNVVIDALEKKGGEEEVGTVTSYRLYIAAVNGIDLSVTDASTSWTQIKGWLASEQGGRRWAWNLVRFFMILIAFYFAASIVAKLARHASARMEGASQLLTNFLGKFVKQVVRLIGLIVALSALEVNIGPLLAAVGAAGFIVAFALQDTLSNFASGLLILAYRPFDVGDFVEAGGVSGNVKSVSLFSTQIATPDNKMMIVPNNDIWGNTITNATASDTRRVDMVFGIGYQDDIEQAKSILERLLQEHDLVLNNPAPVVQVHELADSSVNFVCRPWTETADYWPVYWDITRAVKEAFDQSQISIPYPQRDLHIIQEAIPADESTIVKETFKVS
jgi:small conductance mechanosensitive channel